MTIGKVAKSVGISVQAVRFYEKQGLIQPSKRSPSGYRIYDESAVSGLKFIRGARALGFSLPEISSMMEMLEAFRAGGCPKLKDMLQAKLGTFRQDMACLNSRYSELSSVVEGCGGKGKCKGDKFCSIEGGKCPVFHRIASIPK